MKALVNDRWTATFRVKEIGRYGFKVQGWVDHFETWSRDLLKRIKAESDAAVDYLIGADLVDAAAGRASGADAAGWRQATRKELRAKKPPAELRSPATDPLLHEMALRYPDKRFATESDRETFLVVDPQHARFSAWYEFFPRSTSPEPGKHGTFCRLRSAPAVCRRDGISGGLLAAHSPRLDACFAKGPNNNPESKPGDEGSPWAIGSCRGRA